ncbi:MAG: hypothetical protein NVS3B12_21880 [Acidimicrobiales bacterium]
MATDTDGRGSTRASPLTHVPALDGMRGLAVVAVVLFHSRFSWARGGFLGVTMFFVLSGYLIGGLLLAEHDEHGSIDLTHFWIRRARRLAPAVLVLVALVVAYLGLASRTPAPGILGDGLASLAWVANWRFVFEHQTYAALFSDPTPFQHMWSLAVEEQFYLVLPLTAVLLLGRGRGFLAGRWRLGVVAGLAIVASTAAAALLHPAGAGPGRAYYGTDARVAEPLVGVVLALLLVGRTGRRMLPRPARAAIGGAGIAGAVGLVVMIMRVTERTDSLYRGGFLLAAVCSAAVIAAASQPSTLVARVLSIRPLTALGRISYGVYLFHWPIFLWLSEHRTDIHQPLALLGVRSAATLGLAVVSYVAVERPVRWGQITDRLAALGWADAAVALVSGLAVVTMAPSIPTALAAATHPSETPVSAAAGSFLPASPHTSISVPAQSTVTTARIAPVSAPASVALAPLNSSTSAPRPVLRPGAGAANLEHVTSGPPPPPPAAVAKTGQTKLKVAVVGDSMADGLARGLNTWASGQDGVVIYNLATDGCPLSLGGGSRRQANGQEGDIHPICGWWGDSSSDRSRAFDNFAPDVVVMQDGMNELLDRKLPSWSTYSHTSQPRFDNYLLTQYSNAVKRFTANGARIVSLNAACADWELMGGGFVDYADNGDGYHRVQSLDRTDTVIAASGVRAGDLNAHLCPNGTFTQSIDGVDNARPDGYHLSDTAAIAVAQHWLGPLVLSAVSGGSTVAAPTG